MIVKWCGMCVRYMEALPWLNMAYQMNDRLRETERVSSSFVALDARILAYYRRQCLLVCMWCITQGSHYKMQVKVMCSFYCDNLFHSIRGQTRLLVLLLAASLSLPACYPVLVCLTLSYVLNCSWVVLWSVIAATKQVGDHLVFSVMRYTVVHQS